MLSSVANAGAAAKVATGARCVREGADDDGMDTRVPAEGSTRECKAVTDPARVPGAVASTVPNDGKDMAAALAARCVREDADDDGMDTRVPAEGGTRECKAVTDPARVPGAVATALVAMPSDGTDVDVCTAGLATGRGTTDVSNICNAGLAACRSSTGIANI